MNYQHRGMVNPHHEVRDSLGNPLRVPHSSGSSETPHREERSSLESSHPQTSPPFGGEHSKGDPESCCLDQVASHTPRITQPVSAKHRLLRTEESPVEGPLTDSFWWRTDEDWLILYVQGRDVNLHVRPTRTGLYSVVAGALTILEVGTQEQALASAGLIAWVFRDSLPIKDHIKREGAATTDGILRS